MYINLIIYLLFINLCPLNVKTWIGKVGTDGTATGQIEEFFLFVARQIVEFIFFVVRQNMEFFFSS